MDQHKVPNIPSTSPRGPQRNGEVMLPYTLFDGKVPPVKACSTASAVLFRMALSHTMPRYLKESV